MVAVGLFPITGQPLLLISKGGTSTLVNCIYIWMLLSISRYTIYLTELKKKEKEEQEELLREQAEMGSEYDLSSDISMITNESEESTNEKEFKGPSESDY